MQQHLLLLLNDSVESKKKTDELSTKNQSVNNQLKNDSVEHKKRIDELFTENQKLNQQLKKTKELSTKSQLLTNQLKNDSVGHKKRIDELFNENEWLNQQLKKTKEFSTKGQLLNNQLKNDSVGHKKRIDELFTENQRLNQQLKETKADLNLFKESAEQKMISELLDPCVTDVCDDFNKLLIERYNDYLKKGNRINFPNTKNSLLRKFCSFEEILVEVEVQKGIDQFTKEVQKINNNFIQDKMLHAYKRSKIDSIDDLNKIKTILPSSSSCWKYANEKMKRYVDICCNFEHMKQGLKLANFIERRIKQVPSLKQLQDGGVALHEGNKCLYLNSFHYYQVTLASLPVKCIIKNTNVVDIDVTITVSPKDNVVTLTFKADANGRCTAVYPLLVDAAGQQPLTLKSVVQFQEYICEQSINELKDMGYIVNDGFVLRIH